MCKDGKIAFMFYCLLGLSARDSTFSSLRAAKDFLHARGQIDKDNFIIVYVPWISLKSSQAYATDCKTLPQGGDGGRKTFRGRSFVAQILLLV